MLQLPFRYLGFGFRRFRQSFLPCSLQLPLSCLLVLCFCGRGAPVPVHLRPQKKNILEDDYYVAIRYLSLPLWGPYLTSPSPTLTPLPAPPPRPSFLYFRFRGVGPCTLLWA